MTATITGLDDRTDLNRRAAARLPFTWLVVPAGIFVVLGVLALALGLWPLWIVAVLVVIVGLAYVTTIAPKTVVPGLLVKLGARPLAPGEMARVANLVEGLSVSSGVPEPDLYVIDEDHPNLACFGAPGDAAIVVTTGLIASLGRVELEGVIAEAMGRIRSRDAELAGLAALFVCGAQLHNGPTRNGRPMALVSIGVSWRSRRLTALLGPDRDMLADLTAVSITRYPPGLYDALQRLDELGTAVADCPWGAAHLWMADPLGDIDSAEVARLNAAFRERSALSHRIDLLGEL